MGRSRLTGARSPHELKKIFASVPYIVDIDDSIGQPRPRLRISIDQDRLEFFGVEQRDVYDTIAGAVRRHHGRLFAPRRGPQPDRDRGAAAQARPVVERVARLDAGAGQQRARQQDRGRARRRGARHQGGRLADHLPPRRTLRRHGDGRTRRRLRGADLRHARRRQTHRGARLGRARQADDSLPRPAG